MTQSASAAQLTDRSVQLSSSSKAATGVTYNFNFTSSGTAGAAVILFCTGSPIILDTCTAPGGLSTAGATAGDGATISGTPTGNKAVVTYSATGTTEQFTLIGVTNPTAAGTIYARVVTYDTAAHADTYTGTSYGDGGNVDEGAVALAITDTIGVSGVVREELTFCVSGALITNNCASGLTSTALELGETVGTGKALSSSAISTADVYTQLSTNALSGAVVRIKNTSNTCGGLNRVGETTCDIAAAGASWATTAVGQAKFGVLVDDAGATDLANPLGALDAAAGSDYGSDHYALNQSGVVSTYGDPLLDTGGQLAAGKVVKLTFGASITPGTPAGRYNANLSLVATGTF